MDLLSRASARRLLLASIGVIAVAEAILMVGIALIGGQTPDAIVVLADAFLVAAIAAPALLYFLYRPLVRGIKDRRTVEEKLRYSDAFLRSIIETEPECVKVLEPDGTLLQMNRAGLEMIEAPSLEAVVGRCVYDLVSPEDRAAFRALTEQVCAGQPGMLQFRMIGFGGAERWLETHAVPFSDPEGRALLLAVTRDITERRRQEQENRDLERLLRQSQKLEAIGTLAGGIAHDFNNILAAIMGYTELSLLLAKPQSRERTYLGEVLVATNRARNIIQQILTFSRTSDEVRRPLLVHLIAKETMKLLRASIPSTIEIRDNLRSDCGSILADPNQIQQVLMNLCTNAAQAMPDGGLLEVALARIETEGDGTGATPCLRLTVRDTGSGIPEAIKHRIFEPYFTTKDPGHGTGLGLAVVHGIVAAHGGNLEFTSTEGQGTTFVVDFPALEALTEVDHALEQEVPRGHEHILFVDDEPAIAAMSHDLLQDLGYRVTATHDSGEALSLFQANPDAYDLVITDQTMPGLTGDALASKLAAQRPGLPVIVCSGYSNPVTQLTTVNIACTLSKPLRRAQLAGAIREVLDRRNPRS